MNKQAFSHQQAAHCESGVLSNILTNSGLRISEPMVFGLASALAFAYLPFVKIYGMPLIAYRMPPRSILKGVQKRLGIEMKYARFRDPERGMAALDETLKTQRFVGLQTSVYWLPYFPDEMRFHFNAHNLLVYGKTDQAYQISDPVFEEPVLCNYGDLKKSRFAKGALAAKGLMYYPEKLPDAINWESVIPKAIQRNYRTMNKAPLPIIGIRGMRYLAKNIRKLGGGGEREKKYLRLKLAHIVRMQEEIGTGGAGFRFLYASFLSESAALLDSSLLQEAADAMTQAGDLWREFAHGASKMCKRSEMLDGGLIGDLLNRCADRETDVWMMLKGFK